MTKTRLILILAFIVVFVAGAAATIVSRPKLPTDRHSLMALRLNLTESQGQQLHDIWEEARMQAMQRFSSRRIELREQRDEAIRQILSSEILEKYEQIQEQYRQQRHEMDEARRATFEAAREQTRALLNDEQREQWEQISRHRRGRHPHGPRHHRPPGAPSQNGPDDP